MWEKNLIRLFDFVHNGSNTITNALIESFYLHRTLVIINRSKLSATHSLQCSVLCTINSLPHPFLKISHFLTANDGFLIDRRLQR